MPKGIYKRSEEQKRKMSVTHKKIGTPWLIGKKLSEKTKQKMKYSHKGSKNYLWKGDLVGYRALHRWVQTWKGKADHCEACGDDKKYRNPRHYQWANVDHKYRRVLEDYISFCVKCHKKFDSKKCD
ncbi:MAG: NUMOD3 domain-containing DNA-binding protein [Patescibacteria group bacterium]